MKITALVENTCHMDNICAEHGLSLYIQTAHHNILFDMGQGDAFVRNAQTLGIDLAAVDIAFLSHGHYDHGGGLATFLACNTTAPVYLNQKACAPYYHGSERFIGVDSALATSDRLRFTGETCIIDDTLHLHACNTRLLVHPIDAAGLSKLCDGMLQAEDFQHEHYLSIFEDGKHVLISGCSHKGIVNIVDWFQPDILIGGFHLKDIDPEGAEAHRLDDISDALLHYPTAYYTCHCTGTAQYARMQAIMGDQLHYLSCGQTITL